MLTTLEAAHALRKTAAWLRDPNRGHERCHGIFYRTFNPRGVCSSPFEAEQWCAVGRLMLELGRPEYETGGGYEFWLGSGELASEIERWFDCGRYHEAAAILDARASVLEGLISETLAAEHARA